jgi:hypothetical protein
VAILIFWTYLQNLKNIGTNLQELQGSFNIHDVYKEIQILSLLVVIEILYFFGIRNSLNLVLTEYFIKSFHYKIFLHYHPNNRVYNEEFESSSKIFCITLQNLFHSNPFLIYNFKWGEGNQMFHLHFSIYLLEKFLKFIYS